MLKRPSSRRRSRAEPVALNLVPIIDTLVTLIAFMLFSMSFIALVHMESPFPVASSKDVEEKLKKRPLQLTVSLRERDTEIWSPFDVIPARTLKHEDDGTPAFAGIHATLLEIKAKFPTETKLVFVPHSSANYEVLVTMMDSMRLLTPTDPAIYMQDSKTGTSQVVQTLFPEIIFGNLLDNPRGGS